MSTRRRTTLQALTAALRARADVFAWLGTFLLAVNLVAAAVLPAPAVAAVASPGAIEVCTPDGMIWIDADGHRLDPNGHPAHGVACQFCLPLLHAAFSPAAPPAIPLPAQIALPVFAPTAPPLPSPIRPRHPGQPRAPPTV